MPAYDDLVNVLDEITERIVEWQSPDDGGWCEDPIQPDQVHRSDVWTTAEMMLWLMQYGADRYQQQIGHAKTFLTSMQHMRDRINVSADGGWRWHPDRQSDATATTLALLCLVRYARFHKDNPDAYRDLLPHIRSGRDWLIEHRNPDGGWSLLPEPNSSSFNTCWGCIALSECQYVPGVEDPRIAASIRPHVLSLVETSRRADGWGEVFTHDGDAIGTPYSTYLLLALGSKEAARTGHTAILRTQGDDGGWDPGPALSTVEATAWSIIVLLSGLALDMDPRTPRIQSGVDYLRRLYVPRQGWPVRQGDNVKLWSTYYASLALLDYVDTVRKWESQGGIPGSRRRRKVFIVHGHNEALRSEAKVVVQSAGFEPLVLIEQPPNGRTIREQFEYYASQEGVDYALVLCTPDDMNLSESSMTARGNVVFELGWFSARLGPDRMCIVCDPSVKLPTDLDGVIRVDPRKTDWKDKVILALQDFRRRQEAADHAV